jgi:uncharacterized protein (TIGR02001 family)
MYIKRTLVTAALFGLGGMFSLTSMADEAATPESPHAYSANIGLYSQYVWRGMTQTGKQPALQGGVDYAHGSGFYAGAWVSNVSWLKDGDASLYKSGGTVELDLYGGYGGEFGETGIGYDLGAIQYLYPGSKRSGNPNAHATELYAGLSYGWLSARYSHAVSDDAWGFDDARGTAYYEVNADIPLGDSGFSLDLHVGSFKYDGKAGGVDNGEYDYEDWKVGLTKAWKNGVNIGGHWTDNNADKSDGWVREMTEGQFTVFVQKVF